MRLLITKFQDFFDPSVPGLGVLRLPTGYGKTELFLQFAEMACDGNIERAVYVSPLRTLNEDLYRKLVERVPCLRENSDILAREYMERRESPFFHKKVIVTTIDTIGMHLHKIPIPELRALLRGFFKKDFSTRGHYPVSRSNVSESLVFIDEPHLMVLEKGMKQMFYNTLYYLLGTGATVVLASATIPGSMISNAKKLLETTRDMLKIDIKYTECLYGEKCGEADGRDEDFEEKALAKRVSISMSESLNDSLSLAIKRKREGKRVLIILNTRETVLKAQRKLLELGEMPILLHGLLSKNDREERTSELLDMYKRGESYIALATSVVEAGIDISSDFMVAELSPLPSLIQRAGRLLRKDEDVDGELVILTTERRGPYDAKEVEVTKDLLVERLNRVALKAPWGKEGKMGYMKLVEEWDGLMRSDEGHIQYRKDNIKYKKDILSLSPRDQTLNINDFLTGELGRRIVSINAFIEGRRGDSVSVPVQDLFAYPKDRLLNEIRNIETCRENGKVLSKEEFINEIETMLSRERSIEKVNLYLKENCIESISISEDLYADIAYGGR
ncbi:MAG: CRISPR-associated helicase Cas3' [Fervidicoccaceae archaeon]